MRTNEKAIFARSAMKHLNKLGAEEVPVDVFKIEEPDTIWKSFKSLSECAKYLYRNKQKAKYIARGIQKQSKVKLKYFDNIRVYFRKATTPQPVVGVRC